MPNFLTQAREVPRELDRLRFLGRPIAVPGWILIVWKAVEKIATLDWVRSQTEQTGAMTVFLMEHGSTAGMILGFLWLGWLVVREPRNTAPAQASSGLARLKAPNDDLRRRGQIALRKRAEELARGLLGFVEAQRNRQPDLGDRLHPRVGAPAGQMEPFDPLSYALKEYRVQYKDNVSKIYSEFFGGSLLRRPLSSGFTEAIERMTGSPDDPTTFNEIVAIALELELKASKLPNE